MVLGFGEEREYIRSGKDLFFVKKVIENSWSKVIQIVNIGSEVEKTNRCFFALC